MLLWIIFLLLLMTKRICPCDSTPSPFCYRLEFYGVQYIHFFLFAVLGMMYPDKFYEVQAIGVVIEIVEYFMDKHEEATKNLLGGCFHDNPTPGKKQHPAFFKVYRGESKYYNPIDKLFGIKNSTEHFYNGSVAELVPNVLGFLVGKLWVIS